MPNSWASVRMVISGCPCVGCRYPATKAYIWAKKKSSISHVLVQQTSYPRAWYENLIDHTLIYNCICRWILGSLRIVFTAYTSIHHADTGIFHKLRDTFRCKIRHFTPILSVFYRTASKRYNFAFYTTERSFQFSIINYLSVTKYLFLCVAEDKFLPRTICFE